MRGLDFRSIAGLNYRKQMGTTTVHGSYATFTLRIERDQLERLRVVAEAEDRTVNQELRRMIRQRLVAEGERAAA